MNTVRHIGRLMRYFRCDKFLNKSQESFISAGTGYRVMAIFPAGELGN
jgi:hypothetical protein